MPSRTVEPVGEKAITIGPPRRVDPWIEKLAWMMDNSIPIGRWSVGLDGLLGLIPGFGDFLGAVVSALIVSRAVMAGLPRVTIARMIGNVAMDSFLGSIPFVGDLFDFAYKSNAKNVKIYRESLHGNREPVKDWLFVVITLVALLALIVVPIVAAAFLLRYLVR
jgi:hypothetical protein